MLTPLNIYKPIDKDSFYTKLRKSQLFKGRIITRQVDGMEAVINGFDKRKLADKRWLAYMFATTYHETAKTMQPIEEDGKGKGRDYGKMFKMGGGVGKRIVYIKPHEFYYGRGLVQLTWYENYELMGRLLGIDLLNHPEKALEMSVAVDILFEGMTKAASSFGDFTGRSLEQYFNTYDNDPINARKIINSLDCARLIAEYHKVFLICLN